MECNHKVGGFLLPLIILILAIWPESIFSFEVSRWIVIIAAGLMLAHALFCKSLLCNSTEKAVVKPKARKKKK